MDKQPLYTDLTITAQQKIGLKRYFDSIKRGVPNNWKILSDENYVDQETFLIIESYLCLQSPYILDSRSNSKLSARIFLGLTDQSINLVKVDLCDDISKNDNLEGIGFIIHLLHEQVLKTNKHYQNFCHTFEFRGPKDENWSKKDIRDARSHWLLSKDENKVYILDKTEHTSIKGKDIYFPSANSISLALSITKKSYKRALKLHNSLFGKVKNKVVTIKDEKHSLLYDYLEEITTSIIFSYTAIETMSNAAIPEDFFYEKINDKRVKEIWSKENIERWMSTSEKISVILPLVLKTTDIKQEAFWHKFKELEKLRNKLIHQRTIEDGTRLDTEVYKEMIDKSTFDKIKSSLSVLLFFYNYNNAHPYFPLGLGMAKYHIIPIENMEKHFKVIERE